MTGRGVRRSQAIEVSPELAAHTNRERHGQLFQLSFHWLPACGLKDTRGFQETEGQSRTEASYNFKVLPFVV